MTEIVINSNESLQRTLGDIRSMWEKSKFLRLRIKEGKDRSLDQNAISHAWYEQIARERQEDDALGWKCYCKLHYGVPILRAEDDEFRELYDAAIKGMPYEKKLLIMRAWPVTSIMTKPQLSKYLVDVQAGMLTLGVLLQFPEVAQ